VTDFDRLKPRADTTRRRLPAPRGDQEGKGALFSSPVPVVGSVPLGTITLLCSSCEVSTAVTPWQALVAAVPSVHLPLLRKDFPSWMRCPACRRRTWVRVGIRLS
jgi:hypothetical protein